ncbi:hypothetical protein ACJMK2_024256, partial [Sinanodonta woodiana]
SNKVPLLFFRLKKKMSSSRRTTSDQEKPTVFVQPSRTEKVSRDVSPTVSPFSARRRHANEPILPNVPLDASLIELNAGLYEDLGLLLHKDDAWRKLLQTEEKVTRKMEMDACSYMEGFRHKQGKKALDILSDKGWTIQRMRDSFHQLGLMDCLDLLERVLGAEEIAHINNGISVENLNAGPISASSLSINSQQSVDSEGLGTETDSVSSDQMFGGGNGERIEARSARTDTVTAVQQVRPVSEPFVLANDPGWWVQASTSQVFNPCDPSQLGTTTFQ